MPNETKRALGEATHMQIVLQAAFSKFKLQQTKIQIVNFTFQKEINKCEAIAVHEMASMCV